MKKLSVLFLLLYSLAWAVKDEVVYVDGKPVVSNPSTPDADMSHLRLQRHAPGWRLDQHHTPQGPAPTPAYAPIQGAEQAANVAMSSISMASQHAPPPDFSDLHAEVRATQARIENLETQRRKLEDLFNRYNTPEVITEAKAIEEKVKAFQSQSSIDRIGFAQNKWMTKKIAEGNYGSLSSELDRELRTWSSYTHNKKSVLDLADKFKAQNDRLGNASGDAKTYSEIALQSGIQNLAEAAEIEGGHLPGSFSEKLGISESQLEIAKALLDVGLSMTPGVSVGKDAYEALSGKSLIDGSKLDFTSRSFAVLGVATAGSSNVIKNSLKGLVKIAEASHARGLLGHGFESAIKLAESGITDVVRHSPLNPHALHAKVIANGSGPFRYYADTFRSGTFHTYKTTETTALYRVTDAADEMAHQSGYWTRIKPTSPTQAMIDSALDRSWKNNATKWVEIHVPAGETLHEGLSAGVSRLGSTNMSEFVGGGNQIYINKHVPKEWVQQVASF